MQKELSKELKNVLDYFSTKITSNRITRLSFLSVSKAAQQTHPSESKLIQAYAKNVFASLEKQAKSNQKNISTQFLESDPNVTAVLATKSSGCQGCNEELKNAIEDGLNEKKATKATKAT